MPTLKRRTKELAKTGLRRLFHAGQHLGIDVLPRHFYSAIPDFRELKRDKLWKRPSSMIGVAGAELDGQLAFVARCCTESLRARMSERDIYAEAINEGGEIGYGPTEANFLYCFISTIRPARVMQIGAGCSTALMLKAAREAGYELSVTAVEPYPSEFLRRCERDGKLKLLPQKAQKVAPEALADLRAGDLLFVDSTHTVKPGSEVNQVILEVLPRLTSGVYVHFHDIFFPYDYQRGLMTELTFAVESTLLHAFLINNSKVSIAASLSMLHHGCPRELQTLLPRYVPQPNDHGLGVGTGHFPSATYLLSI